MQTYVWYNRNVGEEAHTFTVIWLINSPLEALGGIVIVCIKPCLSVRDILSINQASVYKDLLRRVLRGFDSPAPYQRTA